jgi:glycosyltransferase involved in cell wall biosynthesis
MRLEDAPLASVIVPVRNARGYVLHQLDAVAAQLVGRDIECIVIDDASSDGTTALVQTWIDQTRSANEFRLLVRKSRGGPNASRNEGLRHARADFLMFTDGDDVVAEGWIDAFMAAADTDNLLAGRNADLRDREAELDPRSQPLEWSPPRWGGFEFAFGNCMAGPRRIFVESGGFDENILLGGSETELAIRAQRRLGVDVVGVPDALVWHRLPTTTTGWFRKHFARERGHAYIRRRHRGAVHQPSIRIGVAQVGRALLRFVTLRARTPTERAVAIGLIARGSGGSLGSIWWGAAYGLRMPPPRLLDGSGQRSPESSSASR